MKPLSKKTKAILATIGTVTAVGALALSSITLAKYVFGRKTKQNAFGLGGERQTSIFFNPNVWTQGTGVNASSETVVVEAHFYMYVWHKNSSSSTDVKSVLSPTANVTPTVEGVHMNLYVFEFDFTTVDQFLFIRWDAKKAGPLSDGSNAFTAGDGFWNQTDDLKYNPAINYYCIDEWGSGSPAKATPATNNIVVGTSELFWSVLSLSS